MNPNLFEQFVSVAKSKRTERAQLKSQQPSGDDGIG
jgi:hypothetical protein